MADTNFRNAFILVMVFVLWGFVHINVSPELANAYNLIITGAAIGYILLKDKLIWKFEVDSFRLEDILWGLIIFSVYIVITAAVKAAFFSGAGGSTTTALQAAFQGLQASAPAFQGAAWAKFGAYSLIALSETTLFVIVYNFLIKRFNIQWTSFNLPNILAITAIGTGFLLFHWTVSTLPSGIQGGFYVNNFWLTQHFIFAAVSLSGLVWREQFGFTREIMPIIWAHVIANVIALLQAPLFLPYLCKYLPMLFHCGV